MIWAQNNGQPGSFHIQGSKETKHFFEPEGIFSGSNQTNWAQMFVIAGSKNNFSKFHYSNHIEIARNVIVDV
jgi:hypothetical protein